MQGKFAMRMSNKLTSRIVQKLLNGVCVLLAWFNGWLLLYCNKVNCCSGHYVKWNILWFNGVVTMCAGFQRHELKGMQKDDSVIVPPHVFQPMITDIVRVFGVTMCHQQDWTCALRSPCYLIDDLNRVESPVPRVKRRAEGRYFSSRYSRLSARVSLLSVWFVSMW